MSATHVFAAPVSPAPVSTARANTARAKTAETSRAQTSRAQTSPAQTAPALSGQATSRLRLTRRGRAVFTSLAAAPLVAVALIAGLSGGMATATGTAGQLSTVTVGAGQSLWGLAQELAPGEDPRGVIIELQRVNGLDSTEVRAGQQLFVPSRLAD